MNVSMFSNDKTANTVEDVARNRSQWLHSLGAKKVIELCVGPSLEVLENHYKEVGIECHGNDIDRRWQIYYPKGKWFIGNCFDISYLDYDVCIFAPPLSKGCSGKREDSLQIDQVFPKYTDFLKMPFKKGLLVLPARSLSTREDRKQFYKLLSTCAAVGKVEYRESLAGRRQIRKYVEVLVSK
jgi:hypothetical protein